MAKKTAPAAPKAKAKAKGGKAPKAAAKGASKS